MTNAARLLGLFAALLSSACARRSSSTSALAEPSNSAVSCHSRTGPEPKPVDSSDAEPVSPARERGRREAQVDHDNGRYLLKTYGLAPDWRSDYSAILKDRYGIELDVIAGCVVDTELIGFASGYNEVSLRLLAEKFGPGFEDAARQEARRQASDR